MQMLYPVDVPIQQYIKRVQEAEEVERCCPAACPQCEAKERMKAHGFYSRTIADDDFDGEIRILRYLCGACRRTVSLLPGWALPYLRFSVARIGTIVAARLRAKAAWKAAVPGACYQRGQHWVRRFKKQAVAICLALAALRATVAAPDFEARALQMLAHTGWAGAHRFLFGSLRMHLLGWPPSLAPAGRRFSLNAAEGGRAQALHTSCIDPEKPSS
jgi:Domain of unknown function (DUF6431)